MYNMYKYTVLGDNTARDSSEACSSTWLHLVRVSYRIFFGGEGGGEEVRGALPQRHA